MGVVLCTSWIWRPPTKIVTSYGETIYELVGRTVNPKTINHSVAYVVIAPGGSSLRHYHRQTEESYYVMAGKAFVEIGDKSETLRPGQIVLISLNATAQSLQYGGQ